MWVIIFNWMCLVAVTKINVYLVRLQVQRCIRDLHPQRDRWATGTRASGVPASPVG